MESILGINAEEKARAKKTGYLAMRKKEAGDKYAATMKMV